MQDDISRERKAAELAAYEQIGEQELTAYVRDNVRTRIARLRSRLTRLFAASQRVAGMPPQQSAEPDAPSQKQEL